MNALTYNWNLISDTNLVDKRDEKIINDYYTDCAESFKVRRDLYPEPHMGNLKEAKVVLLGLNPGVKRLTTGRFDCLELEWYKTHGEKVTSILKDNLKMEVKDNPYYYLNDTISDLSPGHSWLEKRIRKLKKAANLNNNELSKKLACIQYFPYHSIEFAKRNHEYLPSQLHNFQLLKEAIDSNKLIVCMRSKSLWEKAIDRKLEGENFIELNNPRSTYLTKPDGKSKGNMTVGDFDKLVAALR